MEQRNNDKFVKNLKEVKICVIGAGASGLFFAANIDEKSLIVLEKTSKEGLKLLMSGSGSCNITNNNYLNVFIEKYGTQGKKIRRTLKNYSNKDLVRYFEEKGVLLETRSDGKIFPKSKKAEDVRKLLINEINKKGGKIRKDYPVEKVEIYKNENEYQRFIINDEYICEKLVIATGGKSYPRTGSDGEIFSVLEKLGIKITNLKPALVPLIIENYSFGDITGVSVQNAHVKILDGKTKKKLGEKTGGILFTETSLSGPAILDVSRYAEEGHYINIQFCKNLETIDTKGIDKSLLNFMTEKTGLPKNLVSRLIRVSGVDENQKAKAVAFKTIRDFVEGFTFKITGDLGFDKAMVTSGGVDLEEIDLNTFECNRVKNLYIIGEALDVDGDTGGYNLQFAFSSAIVAKEAMNL